MKPDRALRHFLLAFLLALVGYIVCYQAIEHRRTRKGPWRVTFTTGPAGAPAILIYQPRLGITNVQITFAGQTSTAPNPAATIVFNPPKPVPYDVPFGKCVFMDTTFLPGTVTFQLFGHEIELLPRVLVIDGQEHPWQPNAAFALPPVQPQPSGPKQ